MLTSNPDIKDSLVVCQNSQGVEVRATLLRLTPYQAVFEVYSPGLTLRVSEVLSEFRILANDRTTYAGRAVVSNLVNTGTVLVCDAKLEESGLQVSPLSSVGSDGESLRDHFKGFLNQWQSSYRVLPEFKEVMGDLHSFLSALRGWLDQVELEIRASPSGDRLHLQRNVVEELAEPIGRSIDSFIERFEEIAERIEEGLKPAHRAYLRRQLHPLLLCSPFAYRSFHKPLGYAGDYEIVNMIMGPRSEGSTLFAKVLNAWLLGQAPATAHRNRVEYLVRTLTEEASLARSRGCTRRVYNLGCGPAFELQQFAQREPVCDWLQFTLLDFNEETLAHARSRLEDIKRSYGRSTSFQFLKRSVQQILKESAKSVPRPDNQYDLVYCAGLFDYLSDPVCKRLMNIFYEMLVPGGLLLVTNVSDAMNRSHPFRHSMEYLLDWHLIYRNGDALAALAPDAAPIDLRKIIAEASGVNLFLEVRKPNHA